MPRKKRGSLKRSITSDPKYHDQLVAKFMNQIMLNGKKSVAENIVYGAFDIIEGSKKEDPVKVFKEAMEKVKPVLEVRSRRVGGANYQVPMEVRPDRRNALAFRWMILAARKRKGRDMKSRLATEIMEAFEGRGEAVKKREDTHRMAEANKAFAHFRW